MRFAFLVILVGISSCKPEESNSLKKVLDTGNGVIRISKLSKTPQLSQLSSEELEEFRQQEKADSLHAVRTLLLALGIANKKGGRSDFTFSSDSLDIHWGYLFSSERKHLLIKRKFPFGLFFDIYIYRKEGENFYKVLSEEISPFIFQKDTIQDINGDQRQDYVIHIYPAQGCCPRDVYTVYMQKGSGSFTNGVGFINPSFSAEEKVVRGKCYGHFPPWYKFKWRGYQIDTVEYIYADTSTGKYISRKHNDKNSNGRILEQLPAEYYQVIDNRY